MNVTRGHALASPRLIAQPELWILTAISAALHFWRLFTPSAVVFDEVFFERFAGYYLNGGFVFDVHPPLARLLYGAEARTFGLSADALIGGASAPMLRILPALFGIAIIPLVYALLQQLRASRQVATVASIAILLDNALLVDTRLVLADVFLIVFGLIAINAYLAARTESDGTRMTWLTTSAVFAGCALSVKWTGASALGLIGITWMFEMRTASAARARWLREASVLVAIPIAVYFAVFAIDFARVTHEGYRSLWMSDRFKRQLRGNAEFDPAAPALSFAAKLIDTHRGILSANAGIGREQNPQSSPWYTWPIMKHPIALSLDRTSASETAMMQLLGNPVVWWGGLIGVLFGIVQFARRREVFGGYEFGFFFLLGGIAINYLPFIAIRRQMYLYHYLFALLFVVAFAAYVVGVSVGWMRDDASSRTWNFASRKSAAFFFGVIALMLVSFLYFAPFTYGLALSNAAIEQRFWVLHPRL